MTIRHGVDDVVAGVALEDYRPLVEALPPLDSVSGGRFGLYALAGTDCRAELGRAVERRVFFDSFWNDPAKMDAEYGPYDPSSVMIVGVDLERGVPVLTLRIVLGGLNDWKSLSDIEHVWGLPRGAALDMLGAVPGTIADMATAGIEPSYRNSPLRSASWAAVLLLCEAAGLGCVVSILDTRVLHLNQRAYARPWTVFSGLGARDYLGSVSWPVHMALDAYLSRVRADSAALGALFSTAGLHRSEVAFDLPDAIATLNAVRASLPG